METLDKYQSAAGIITSPGAFLGAPTWAPYFDRLTPDELFLLRPDVSLAAHVVGVADRARFPSLAGVFAVVLSYSASGPIAGHSFATDYQLGIFLAECGLAAAGA